MLYTTLKLCRKNHACLAGYKTMKKSLPKDHKDDDPISLQHIIESNGYKGAIWALRATTEPCYKFITEYALWCADQVLEIYEKKNPDDRRVRECLDGVRKFQKGEISKEDLTALRNAAYGAYGAYAADMADVDYTTADYAVADAAFAAACAADAAYVDDTADAAYDACDAANSYGAVDVIEEQQKSKLIEMLKNHKAVSNDTE